MKVRILQREKLSVLRVFGEDAVSFLQGQSTQDMRGEVGFCRYGLWLNHTGKIAGDSYLLRTDEESFLLVSQSTDSGLLKEKLERFIIADDVDIEDLGGAYQLTEIYGDDSSGDFGEIPLPPNGAFKKKETGFWFWVMEGPFPVLALLEKRGESLIEKYEMGEAISFEEAEGIRIRADRPRLGVDLTDHHQPESGNFDTAISYTKGCYLGQEVVARMHRLGRVAYRLERVIWQGKPVAIGVELLKADEGIGRLTSCGKLGEQWIGYVLVKASQWDNRLDAYRFSDGTEVVPYRNEG